MEKKQPSHLSPQTPPLSPTGRGTNSGNGQPMNETYYSPIQIDDIDEDESTPLSQILDTPKNTDDITMTEVSPEFSQYQKQQVHTKLYVNPSTDPTLYRSKKSTMSRRAPQPSQTNPADNKYTKDIANKGSIKVMKVTQKRGKTDPLHHGMNPFSCLIISTAKAGTFSTLLNQAPTRSICISSSSVKNDQVYSSAEQPLGRHHSSTANPKQQPPSKSSSAVDSQQSSRVFPYLSVEIFYSKAQEIPYSKAVPTIWKASQLHNQPQAATIKQQVIISSGFSVVRHSISLFQC